MCMGASSKLVQRVLAQRDNKDAAPLPIAARVPQKDLPVKQVPPSASPLAIRRLGR